MNLFDLSAKIDLQMGNFEKALTDSQKKVIALEKELEKLNKTTGKHAAATKSHADATTNLGHAFKALTNQVIVVDGPLGGIASRMRAMSGEASELSAALGVGGPIIAGLVAMAGAALLAGDALFHLAEKTAKYGDEVFKAHEKTALSVSTLSALKVAGDAVGVELSSMTTGLIRFTNNLELAASGNKKMIDVFKQLGVTAFQDNDKALSQFIAKFATLRTDQERTVAAGQAFGVRFGASLVEVFNRVGGNVDVFKDKLREMGLLMTDEDAEAAHKFSVDLNMLEMRIAGVGRTIGRELIPAFDAGFSAIEAALAANKTSWKEWGETLAKVILTVESLIGGLANVIHNADWTNLIPIYGSIKEMREFGSGVKTTGNQVTQAYLDMVNPRVGAGASIGAGTPRFHTPEAGSGREKKAPRDPGVELLKQLTNEYNRLSTSTKVAEVQLQLQEAAFAKLNPRVREAILMQADLIDKQKEKDTIDKQAKQEADRLQKVTEDTTDALRDQLIAISDLQTGMPAWQREALTFIETAKKQGYVWRGVTEDVYLLNAAYIELLKTQAQLKNDTQDMLARMTQAQIELHKELDDQTKKQSDDDAKSRQEKLDAFNDKMRNLAAGVTNVLDRAITDGFDHGIKAGLKSFEIGILEMIKSAALAALEARLAKIFGKLLGGGSDSNDDEGDSGGSSNSGLGSIFSVFKNLFKPHAMGLNYVPYDGYLASLHRGEAVVPASQNKPGGAGGHTFVVNINVPDIHSAGSRQTQYQVAKAIQGHLAKAVLVG